MFFYTVGHKGGIKYFLHNFMGYFLQWELFRMSRVCTTTMLGLSLFLTYSHKIRQHWPSTSCVSLAWNEKEPLEQQNFGFCHNFSTSVSFKDNSILVILLRRNFQLYCFECHSTCLQNQVWPQATPGRTRASRGRRTLSTRLPMVAINVQSVRESWVRAWANSCRVRGRLSLLMMARPKSTKACSIGSISRSKRVMVPTTAHILQQKKFFCSSQYTGKRCRLAAECCFYKLFLGVEGISFPECPATWRCWRFHPEPPVTFFFLYEDRPIPPLSRHHIEPVPEYSNVGGSHHLVDGQSVFHLCDQGCSALSSWRQHITSVLAATFYAP